MIRAESDGLNFLLYRRLAEYRTLDHGVSFQRLGLVIGSGWFGGMETGKGFHVPSLGARDPILVLRAGRSRFNLGVDCAAQSVSGDSSERRPGRTSGTARKWNTVLKIGELIQP
jgi:hypothetical protein